MKKQFTKSIAICLILIISLGFFAGCGSAKSSMIDEDGTIVLDFWSIYPQGDPNYKWMIKTISRFEEENPGIKIRYTGISFWDYFTKITTAMTDVTGPEVYLQTIKDTNDRARGGVSMNLSPFFTDTFNAGEQFFFSQDVDPMTYEGNVYGLPYSLDNRILYYNIDIVNTLKDTTDEDWTSTKVGKKEGTTITGKPADLINADGNVRAPRTWDEMLAYQQLLTVQTDGKITQLGFDVKIGNFQIENVVWTNGGEYFDANGKPIVDSNPGVRKGFEVWYELTHTLSQAKVNAFVDSAGSDSANLFWTGLVGLMIATNEIPWQNDKLGEDRINLGAAPIPYNGVEENRFNFTGGFSLEIANRLSKEPKEVQQAAFRFIRYLTDERVQREVMSETSNLPALRIVYEELEKTTEDPAKIVVFQEMIHRKPFNYIYNAPNWWGEVYSGATEFISDKRTLDETLTRSQKAIEQLQLTY